MLVIINDSVTKKKTKQLPTKRNKKKYRELDGTVKWIYFLVIGKLTPPKGYIVKGAVILRYIINKYKEISLKLIYLTLSVNRMSEKIWAPQIMTEIKRLLSPPARSRNITYAATCQSSQGQPKASWPALRSPLIFKKCLLIVRKWIKKSTSEQMRINVCN